LARRDFCQHWAVVGSADWSCNSHGNTEQSATRSVEALPRASKKKAWNQKEEVQNRRGRGFPSLPPLKETQNDTRG